MASELLPATPVSPILKDNSDEDDDLGFPCGQKRLIPTKTKTTGDRITLLPPSYKLVKDNAETLKGLQAAVIHLTTDIKRLDTDIEKNTVPKHLRVYKNHPRLPRFLNPTPELLDSWKSSLERSGRRLSRDWRAELSRQCKRQTERFLEKEKRAYSELEGLIDSVESARLLTTLLRKSKQKEEEKGQQLKSHQRPHPYRR